MELDVIVDIDPFGDEPITGYVVGNQVLARHLDGLATRHEPFRLMTETTRRIGDSIISSDTAFVYPMGVRSLEPRPDGSPFGTVAKLEFDDLTHETRFGEGPVGPPAVFAYYLRGELPDVSASAEVRDHHDGSSSVNHSEAVVDLASDLGWKLTLMPQYRHWSEGADRRRRHQWMIEARPTRDTRPEPPDAVVDDLLLILSYLSRHWIAWHTRLDISDVGIRRFVRRTRPVGTVRRYWKNPLDGGYADYLAAKAIPNLRRLRSQGLDLTLPLATVISSDEGPYIEQRFAALFMALENIRDQYAKTRNLKYVTTHREFSAIGAAIRSQLLAMELAGTISPDARIGVEGKLLELRRRSINDTLAAMFTEFKVDWKDLYPPLSAEEKGIPFVNIRNNLFHSARPIPMRRLQLEIIRLGAVLDRIFLSLLGWHRPNQVLRQDEAELLKSELGS